MSLQHVSSYCRREREREGSRIDRRRNALRDKSSREVECLRSICIDPWCAKFFKSSWNFQSGPRWTRARLETRLKRHRHDDGGIYISCLCTWNFSPRSNSQPSNKSSVPNLDRFVPRASFEKVSRSVKYFNLRERAWEGKRREKKEIEKEEKGEERRGATEKVEVTTGRPRWPLPRGKQMEKVSTLPSFTPLVWLTGNMSRSKLVADGRENQSTARSAGTLYGLFPGCD